MTFLKNLADWVRANVPILGSYIADVLENAESLVESFTSGLFKVADSFNAFISSLWIDIKEAGKRLAKVIQDNWPRFDWLFTTRWDSVEDFFSSVGKGFADWVTKGVNSFNKFLDETWKDFTSSYDKFKSSVDDFLKDPIKALSGFANKLWNLVKPFVDPLIKDVDKKVDKTKSDLTDKINDQKTYFNTRVDDLTTYISNKTAEILKKYTDLATDYDDYKKKTEEAINKLNEGIGGIWQRYLWESGQIAILWEAAKAYGRKRTAEKIQEVMSDPKAQAAISGGELGAWLWNPALGFAVWAGEAGLETWSLHEISAGEAPVLVKDNPIAYEMFKTVTVELPKEESISLEEAEKEETKEEITLEEVK